MTSTAGCSLVLADFDVVEKMESLSKAERDFVCTLLFHTINWFREVSKFLQCWGDILSILKLEVGMLTINRLIVI